MISGLAPLRGARARMPSDISEFSVVKEKEQLNGLKSLIASAYFNQKISEFSVVKKIHLRNLINLAASQQIKQAYLHSTCTSFRSFKRVRMPVINLSGFAPLRGARARMAAENIMNNE